MEGKNCRKPDENVEKIVDRGAVSDLELPANALVVWSPINDQDSGGDLMS